MATQPAPVPLPQEREPPVLEALPSGASATQPALAVPPLSEPHAASPPWLAASPNKLAETHASIPSHPVPVALPATLTARSAAHASLVRATDTAVEQSAMAEGASAGTPVRMMRIVTKARAVTGAQTRPPLAIVS